jgi:hypothetical protein
VRLSLEKVSGRKGRFRFTFFSVLSTSSSALLGGDRLPTIILTFRLVFTSFTLSLLIVEFMIYKVSFRSRLYSFHSVRSFLSRYYIGTELPPPDLLPRS